MHTVTFGFDMNFVSSSSNSRKDASPLTSFVVHEYEFHTCICMRLCRVDLPGGRVATTHGWGCGTLPQSSHAMLGYSASVKARRVRASSRKGACTNARAVTGD